jgi:chemotaxis protein CheD
MRVIGQNEVERVNIAPGECFVSREPVIISTLLGSCVSACLYDPIQRVIGMNHFLLAGRRSPIQTQMVESEAGRYGIHAMKLLINGMEKQGAERRNLRAKLFGGGDVLQYYQPGRDNSGYVGEVNNRFAVAFLHNEQIPVVASDLGRDYGRTIHFRSADFAVFMRKIGHSDKGADTGRGVSRNTKRNGQRLSSAR